MMNIRHWQNVPPSGALMKTQKCVFTCAFVSVWGYQHHQSLAESIFLTLNFSIKVKGADLFHFWHVSQMFVPLAHICCSCALAVSFGTWTLRPLSWTQLEKVLRRPCAPPSSSTVTTLFTPHKQAGWPPRFEKALRFCRCWEAHTNSHIQSDMISQLDARVRQEISTVR